jgi:hypothetical protein
MAVTVPNRFFPGSLTDADDVNENFDTLTAYINSTLETTATHNSDLALLPKGKVGLASITASTATYTTTITDLGLSVTFTALASRFYKITGVVLIQSTVADDSVALYIRDGSGTQLQQASQQLRLASVSQVVTAMVTVQPGAGSKTYKLSSNRLTGTGNVNVVAGATFPAFILVEDIGL